VVFFESSDWRAIRLQRPPGSPSSLPGFNSRRIEREKPPIPGPTIPLHIKNTVTETHPADRPIATHIKGSRNARCRFGCVTVIQRPDGAAEKIAKALIFRGPNAFSCRAETRIGHGVKWRGAVEESSRACQRIRIAPGQFERVPRFKASNIALIALITLGGNVESSPRQGDGRFDRERPQQGTALQEHLQNSSAACRIGLRAAPQPAMSPNDRSAT
jgi:hypothetical protein